MKDEEVNNMKERLKLQEKLIKELGEACLLALDNEKRRNLRGYRNHTLGQKLIEVLHITRCNGYDI